MGLRQFDRNDLTVVLAFALAMLSLVGISSHEVFGVTAADSLFGTLDIVGIGIAMTVAGAVAIGVWGFTIITNDRAEIPNDDVYKATVAGSGILTGAVVFIPSFADTVAQAHDLVGIAVVAISTGGLVIVGWMK